MALFDDFERCGIVCDMKNFEECADFIVASRVDELVDRVLQGLCEGCLCFGLRGIVEYGCVAWIEIVYWFDISF